MYKKISEERSTVRDASSWPRVDSPGSPNFQRYLVQEKLVETQLSEIYGAVDKASGRDVVIKRSSKKADLLEECNKYIYREAVALSQLDDAHIVRLLDYGVSGETNFLVLEHLPGITLYQRLEMGIINPRLAKSLFSELCDALQVIHDNNLVHCDITPGNVFLTFPFHKIIDFGLVKFTNAPDRDVARKPDGVLMGTFNYMAPEQALDHEIDHRTDIFAFGVLMYRTLTGYSPFEGEGMEILLNILQKDPKPLDDAPQRIPKYMRKAIMKALEKNPADRFQSAAEMKAALKGYEKTKSSSSSTFEQ